MIPRLSGPTDGMPAPGLHKPIRQRRRWKPASLLLGTAAPLFILLYCSLSQAFTPARTIRPTTQLHGIKGFRAWFESQFPDAITGIPSKGSQESFDHVLIDINQLLHIAVRRSTSDDHALAIMMRELNACVELATPTKSLVLAMDGSPSSAKLATSRKRRLSTLVKTEWKLAQLERFQNSKKLSLSPQAEKRLRRRYAAEVETLRITPGTNFMERANQAMLYWAWQRMVSPDGPLSKVSIYISASDSPGEGEVKILDWILRKRPQGSLAIMGGDSDLVLEGLVIPPSICTHNVFVLLPDLGKRYLVVSLWETTRHLAQLLPQLKAEDIMRVRTDMVLLLILNGNDYLPKLRGSSGFNRVFKAYIQVVREWLEEGKEHLFLVDPDSLTFNLEFGIDFFGRLKLDRPLETAADIAEQQFTAITPLGQLNNLISTQFMPKPMRWRLICDDPDPVVGSNGADSIEAVDNDEEANGGGYDDEGQFTEEDIIEEVDKDDDGIDADDDDELFVFNGSKNAILRLSLGKKGTLDYHCYEIKYDPDSKIKDAKNELAETALEDLLGNDFLESCNDTTGLTPSSYPWELSFPVDSDCKLYLGGLLWNLQTYQDGICSDYGYNYGKRLSPTAEDVVDFFQQALDENRQVGKNDMLSSTFTPPMKNGVSCLAALPSQLVDLIAEPYSEIPSDLVETFYASCVSLVDNAFDIEKFSTLCEAEVAKIKKRKKRTNKITDDGLKKVVLGEDYWTVVFRSFKALEPPFAPPPPVIEKFTPLFLNRRIKAARFAASTKPRARSVWMKKGDNVVKLASGLSDDIDHCGMSELLASSKGGHSVFDVDYWTPYPSRWGKKQQPRQSAPTKNEAVDGEEVNGALQVDPEAAAFSAAKKTSRKKTVNGAEVNGDLQVDPDATTLPAAKKTSRKKAAMNGEQVNGALQVDPAATTLSAAKKTSRKKVINGEDVNGGLQVDPEATTLSAAKKTSRKKAVNDAEANGALLVDPEATTVSAAKKTSRKKAVNGAEANGALLVDPESTTFSAAKKTSRKKAPKRMSDQDLQDRIKEFRMEIDGSTHPEESTDGVTPLSYLLQLEQADMIDFEWKAIMPSRTDFASISPEEFECVELVVRGGDARINSTFAGELLFQRDREVTRGSKQQVKQYLASMALTRLLAQKDKKWFEMKFYELKNMLIPDYDIVSRPRLSEEELTARMDDFNLEPIVEIDRSISDQTALGYLVQLHQDKLIYMDFKSIRPSHTEFAAVAPEDFECIQLVITMTQKKLASPFAGELVFERDRLIGRDQKRAKQHLAAAALARLFENEELPWTEFTYKECKARLKVPVEVGAKRP